MTPQEQIGYIIGKLESMDRKLDNHIEKEEDKFDRRMGNIERCLQKVQEQLSLYRHFVLFVKMLLAVTAAVLAFKFGDIGAIWGRFWHGS